MAEMEEGKGKENVRKGGWTRKIERLGIESRDRGRDRMNEAGLEEVRGKWQRGNKKEKG